MVGKIDGFKESFYKKFDNFFCFYFSGTAKKFASAYKASVWLCSQCQWCLYGTIYGTGGNKRKTKLEIWSSISSVRTGLPGIQKNSAPGYLPPELNRFINLFVARRKKTFGESKKYFTLSEANIRIVFLGIFDFLNKSCQIPGHRWNWNCAL